MKPAGTLYHGTKSSTNNTNNNKPVHALSECYGTFAEREARCAAERDYSNDYHYCGCHQRFRTMFLSRSEYDRGVNTFSPEGRLFQVEYALEAIKLGSTAVGIQCADGVVLAVEKRVTSPLIEPRSIEKIVEIDTHICATMSGLTADARTLVQHARTEAQNHRFNYEEPMPVESVAQAVCDLALRFGESGYGEDDGEDEDSGGGDGSGQRGRNNAPVMSRPFGVALLLAGCDERGPALYTTDPSGTYTRWLAKAIGAGGESAQVVLEERYRRDLSLAEAEAIALQVLRQVMEEKLGAKNIEMARVVPDGKSGRFELYSMERLKACIESMSMTDSPR
jgi:20S proteasome subunit alpha 5